MGYMFVCGLFESSGCRMLRDFSLVGVYHDSRE